jgi:hypothetical protein
MDNELRRVVDALSGPVWTAPHRGIEPRDRPDDRACSIVDAALNSVIAMDAVDVQQSARNS